MRKLTAAAILAATAAALTYRPLREFVGDVLIDAGVRLGYGEPPPMTPRTPAVPMTGAPPTLDAAGLARLDAAIRAERRNGNGPI